MEWISQLGATSRGRTRTGFPSLCLLLTLEACLMTGGSAYSQETCCPDNIPYVRGCQRFCPHYCNGLGACFVQGGCSQYSCLPRDLYGCSPQGGVLPPPEFFRHIQVSRANQEMADPMPGPAPPRLEEVPARPIQPPTPTPQTPVSLPQPVSPDSSPTNGPTVPEARDAEPMQTQSPDSLQGGREPVRLSPRLANRRDGNLELLPHRGAERPHINSLLPSRSPQLPQPEVVAVPQRDVSPHSPPPVQVEPLEVFAAPAKQAVVASPAPQAPPVQSQAPPVQSKVTSTVPPSVAPQTKPQEQQYYLVIEGSSAEGECDAAPPRRPTFIQPVQPAPSTITQKAIAHARELEPAGNGLPAIPHSLRATQPNAISVGEGNPQPDPDAAPELPLHVGRVTLPESDIADPEIVENKTTLRVRSIGPTAVRPPAVVTGVKGCSYQEQVEAHQNPSPVTSQFRPTPSHRESNRTSLRVISVR